MNTPADFINSLPIPNSFIRELSEEEYEEILGKCDDDLTREQIRGIFEEGTSKETIRALEGDCRYFAAWLYLDMGLILVPRPAPEGYVRTDNRQFLPVPEEIIVRFIVKHLKGYGQEGGGKDETDKMKIEREHDQKVDYELVYRRYKTRRGTHTFATVARRVASLSTLHNIHNIQDNPCRRNLVRITLQKSRKANVQKNTNPIWGEMFRKMLDTCDGSLTGKRDRAILLLAFRTGGRRRSEVCGARAEYLTKIGDDYQLYIPKTKTNDEGLTVPIKGEAARALADWLQASGIMEGPIFRSFSLHKREEGMQSLTGSGLAKIIKNRIIGAGYDPKEFSAHGLRAGFITQAGFEGHSLFQVMDLSDHKCVQTAKRYHHMGNVMRNPAADVGEPGEK